MRYLLIIISVILFCLSCKKKNNEPEEEQTPAPASPSAYTVKDYMPLKYGSYWVYQLTVSDTNYVVQASIIDSSYVFDSIMDHGKWFYRISGNSAVQGNFIDSAGYIIYSDGTKMFSLTNNDTVVTYSYSQSTYWYNLYLVMKTNPTSFSYNSQTYTNCVNRFNYMYGNMNPNCPNRIYQTTYCPGVGVVYAKYGYMNTCDIWEVKLLRYKIN